jgi:orotidine-5'-phosphate decarboxylase
VWKVNERRIIVALDFDNRADAERVAGRLDPELCRVKIGKELFTREGPDIVRALQRARHEVFLDLKFHDIPNTVAGAVQAAAALRPWMINVHALGGATMLAAARRALERHAPRPLLIGVTLLTSLAQRDLDQLGVAGTPDEAALRLARLCRDNGLDGVVCSAREAPRLRAELGPDFLLVTPGIRPAGVAAGDQQRTATPLEALEAGSDYLVVGRPITQAADPVAVLRSLQASIETATAGRRATQSG